MRSFPTTGVTCLWRIPAKTGNTSSCWISTARPAWIGAQRRVPLKGNQGLASLRQVGCQVPVAFIPVPRVFKVNQQPYLTSLIKQLQNINVDPANQPKMRVLSYFLPLLLAPSAALADQAEAAAVSEPLTTDSLASSVIPGGPIQTFPTTAVTTTDTETATTTATDSSSLSLSSESTTNSALHPSEPTGISGGADTATGTGSSASATTTPSSGGSVFADGGPSSRVALFVALGAGLLGWVAF